MIICRKCGEKKTNSEFVPYIEHGQGTKWKILYSKECRLCKKKDPNCSNSRNALKRYYIRQYGPAWEIAMEKTKEIKELGKELRND
jgi:hypothetical protein